MKHAVTASHGGMPAVALGQAGGDELQSGGVGTVPRIHGTQCISPREVADGPPDLVALGQQVQHAVAGDKTGCTSNQYL